MKPSCNLLLPFISEEEIFYTTICGAKLIYILMHYLVLIKSEIKMLIKKKIWQFIANRDNIEVESQLKVIPLKIDMVLSNSIWPRRGDRNRF